MVLSLTSIDNHSVHYSYYFLLQPRKNGNKNMSLRAPWRVLGGVRPKHGILLLKIYPLLYTFWWGLMVRKNGQFESNDGYQKLVHQIYKYLGFMWWSQLIHVFNSDCSIHSIFLDCIEMTGCHQALIDR